MHGCGEKTVTNTPTCSFYKITSKNVVDTDEEGESIKTKVYKF